MGVIVALTDDISWVLHSQACGELILEEIEDPASKVLFVLLQPENDIIVGQTAATLRDEKTKKPVPEAAQAPGGFPNFASFFQNQPPMSFNQNGNNNNGNNGNNQKQINNNNKIDDKEMTGINGFHPNFAPQFPQYGPGGNGANGEAPPGVVFGRSFQVSIQNGTGERTVPVRNDPCRQRVRGQGSGVLRGFEPTTCQSVTLCRVGLGSHILLGPWIDPMLPLLQCFQC